jgi:hypothetical protein
MAEVTFTHPHEGHEIGARVELDADEAHHSSAPAWRSGHEAGRTGPRRRSRDGRHGAR